MAQSRTICCRSRLPLRPDEPYRGRVAPVDVQLSSATVITGRGQALTCADIQPGDRVEGLGQVAPDTFTIDAQRITITGPWLRNAMRP